MLIAIFQNPLTPDDRFCVESTYNAPERRREFRRACLTKTRRNVAMRKDAAYHARGSPSRLTIFSILSAASAILYI